MRTRTIALFLLVLLAVAGWSQSASEPTWSKYTSDNGKFSVMLPGEPTEKSSDANGVVLHGFTVIQRPRVYLIIYSDYPDADLKLSTPERLAAERDGFLKGTSGAKVVSEREFKFKRGATELPALEFTSESPDVNYKSLIVLDGRRVYFACAGSLKGNDSTAQIERFLGSFALH